jgi:hypothetical protein
VSWTSPWRLVSSSSAHVQTTEPGYDSHDSPEFRLLTSDAPPPRDYVTLVVAAAKELITVTGTVF